MSLRILFSLLLAAALLVACGNEHDIRTRIDGDWHRHTLEKDHLEHWLKVLPTANGFFNTAVTRDWQVLDPQPGDIVSHTRSIYLMAVGHELTGKPAYLEQVKLGTDFLLRHFRDPLHGGWYKVVGPDGKPKNDNKLLYSQAFTIFALAHAYRATQDTRYLDAALQTWREIRLRYADAHGGFRAGTNRDFSQIKLGNSQNPIMHLFEALLALHQASGAREAFDSAESIGKFVAYRLLEGLPDGTARIPELFDEQWRPLPGASGGRIDIGHQFECAFLFSAAAEALRALMHHAAIRGRSDLWGHVMQQTEYVRTEFLDGNNGGWLDGSVSECRKVRCQDRQPDGYHMTAMHREAIRIAALAR